MSLSFSLILKEFTHVFHILLVIYIFNLNILYIFVAYSFAGPFNLLSTLY